MPTYQRPDVLQRTITAYCRQAAAAGGIELLIVDDGSTDSTPLLLDSLRGEYPEFITIFRQEKKGPAAARNLALNHAKGEFVLFAGDDVIPSASLLEFHAETHRKYSDSGVAVLGKITWSDENRITPFMKWLESSGMQFGYSLIQDPVNVPVEMFYGSNISLQREFLKDDRFDERFTAACWEDIDLGLRLQKRGLRIVYDERAVGLHVHHTGFRRFARRTRQAGYFRAMLEQKHGIPNRPRTLVREAAKWVVGTPLRLFGGGKLRLLGFRLSLSWHEYLGWKTFSSGQTKHLPKR